MQVIEVTKATTDVEDIINQDKSVFRENHTKEWFNWVLKGGFVDDIRSKQHLFLVKDEEKTILVELFSQDKNERYSIDLYFNDDKKKYYGNYKISYRFAGNCDCSIIPDKYLSHLCDMLVIISEKILKESFSNCNIF